MCVELRNRHENKIIIGDFNLTLNVELDRYNTYSNNTKSREVVEVMMEEFCLRDVWRNQNPDTLEYSWINGGDRQRRSRIDFALVSGGLDQKVLSPTYLVGIQSDHRAFYMVVDLNPFERGRGYWKLNTSLLQDPLYVKKMNQNIVQWISSLEDNKPIEKWEILKQKIKKVTIEYSKAKVSETKLVIAQLSEKIYEYECTLPLTEEQDKILEATKEELEEKLEEQVRGAMFRSKVRWFEEGERNTKYFFSLEKAKL